MKKRILTEASGSLVSAFLIDAIKASGNIAVASDINNLNHSICLADEFILMPKVSTKYYWEKVENILLKNKINVVIPSLDETLLGWSSKKNYFKQKGIEVIISDGETVEICLDKYKTYLFCMENQILTPKTSLIQKYELIKPRFGRGGSGIVITKKTQNMENKISQDFVEGVEFTVDCLFDKKNNPIYIIPRVRLDIKDGKSIKSETKNEKNILKIIKQISQKIKFSGLINFQFIKNKSGIYLIEINPRVAGGMALGFRASNNWIKLIIDNFINNKEITSTKVKWGLKMIRYYSECYI